MKYLLILLSLFFVSSAFGDSNAATKIATVDMSRLINEAPQAKAKRDELNKLSDATKKKIEEKRSALAKLEEKAKDVAPDSEQAEQLRKEAKEFARFVKDSEDELKKNYVKFTKMLAQDALKIVNTYAAKNNIAIVLDKSEGADSSVVWQKEGFDITEQLIKEIKG